MSQAQVAMTALPLWIRVMERALALREPSGPRETQFVSTAKVSTSSTYVEVNVRMTRKSG